MTIPRNALAWSAVSFIALLCAMLTFMVYVLFVEKPFLTYENLPFPPQLMVVKPGEPVPLKVVRCNSSRRTQDYLTTHTMVGIENKLMIVLPDVRVTLSPGCQEGISLLNRVPDNVPAGTYQLFGTAEVRGTVRTHYVNWSSEPFYVME